MSSMPVETIEQAAKRLARQALKRDVEITDVYSYRLADGKVWCWRWRARLADGGKEFRPMYFDGAKFVGKEPVAPSTGKPLYRLPELLAAHPSQPVWIVEGEKDVESLVYLGLVATTSGSSGSADGADWAPLSGRHCVIWPDNDEAGRKYAQAVTAKLRALGCAVELVDIATFGLPEKADCSDWLRSQATQSATAVLALPRITAMGDSPCTSQPPMPLPPALPPVPPFDPAWLPKSLRAWCEDAADGLQVPLDFTAIPAMVGLGGIIGRHVGIRMKRHETWTEFPLLWGYVVGRPSSGKSPALMPTRRFLEKIAADERKAHQEAMREYKARKMVNEAKKKSVSKAKTETDAMKIALDVVSSDEEKPAERRLLVNDATVEKLGEIQNDNPRGVIQFRDELAGWLASCDREGHESDRAFYLECWNGSGSFTVDRIGRGTVHIEACAMSILGGMQPGKLAEYVRGALRGGFSDDGLVQRFQLAVYPDLPDSWRYVDRPLHGDSERRAWETFKRLRDLNPDSIGAEFDDAGLPFLRFDNEAQVLLIAWQTRLMNRLREGKEPAWMESHLSKYRSLVGRLALVLHLADNEHGGPVPASTLTIALKWCEYLEAHARRIYAPALDNGVSAAHLILKHRGELGDGFTARDLSRHQWSGLANLDAVKEGLDVLVDYGHLDAATTPPGNAGGRPSTIYTWRTAL
ncbi:MAG: hypothetical protein RSP_15780 [Rhodanobacter sp.]